MLEVSHGEAIGNLVSLRASLSTVPHYSVASYTTAGASLRLDGGLLLSDGTVEAPAGDVEAIYIGLSNIGIRALVAVNAVLDTEDTLLLESFLRYRARS